jgi:hypothetical protein
MGLFDRVGGPPVPGGKGLFDGVQSPPPDKLPKTKESEK